MNKLILTKNCEVKLRFKKPFSFERTFYQPSHFQSGLELFVKNKYYTGINLNNSVYGLKFLFVRNILTLFIYSEKKLSNGDKEKIIKEIYYRFSLLDDYSSFYDKYSNDKYLKKSIRDNYGKHFSSSYSLYEHLIISTLLQNTTVKRTVQMCETLLHNYGTLIEYDGINLFVLWKRENFTASESELRTLKLGYRAKIITRVTTELMSDNLSDEKLRLLETNTLVASLLKIYGVGKQTVFYLVMSQFHRTEYLKHIPLWERKVLSKYLFNKTLLEENKLLKWFNKRYSNWCGYAFSIIWEDIFHQHKKTPFPWLLKIMKEKEVK
ncbi:MAG TPA: hypothetical protein PLS73_06270 [Saprospiraceae bacterium]|nr:hypothetical protein [Saprospiraceae bacterium]